jgi:hypothetical protein
MAGLAAAIGALGCLSLHAQAPTTIQITVSNTTPNYVTPPNGGYGTTLNPVTLTATVTVTATGAPVTAGTVTFYDNPGIPGAAAPDILGVSTIQFPVAGAATGAVAGTATLPFAFGPGPHTLTATYSGVAVAPAGLPTYAPSTTASSVALTSNGYAAELYGYYLAGNMGTEGEFNPQNSLQGMYFNLNQNPTEGVTFIYGFGLQTPMGTTTISDLTTGTFFSTAPVQTSNVYIPQFAVSDDSYGNVNGNYINELPQSGVSYFFLADVFQSGVPALITLSATQNQVWTNALYGNQSNYNGCTGGTNMGGYSACAVSTPPVQGVAADINGDGLLDLLIAHNDPAGAGSVGVFANTLRSAPCSPNCSAFNAPEVLYATGHATNYVAAGDLNGDGFPDIVAVASDGTNLISVLLNHGDGTFTLSPNTVATGNGAAQIALGDFNQDGILDIAVLNTTDATIGIFTGNGDGTFAAMLAYPVGIDPTAFTMADLNLDGTLDFAIANNDSPTQAEVSFLYGQPGGSFNYVANLATNQLPLSIANYPETNPEPTSIQATDLNGDGYPDLVIGFNINQYVYAMYSPTQGQYAYSVRSFSDTANGINLRTNSTPVADLDGDGVKDILLMTAVNNDTCSGCSPNQNNLMFRLNGAMTYQWTGPAVIDAPLGVHDFTSTYTPNANSIYTPVTAGEIGFPISPQPEVSLTPSNLNFGLATVGTPSPPLTLTLQNIGNGTMTNIAFTVFGQVPMGAPAFTLTNNCPLTLAGGSAPCTIYVSFTPTTTTQYAASIRMTYGSGTATYIGLSGTGVNAAIIPVSIAETITLNDTMSSATLATMVPVNETITLNDTMSSATLATMVPVNETITLNDTMSNASLATMVPVNETITLNDTMSSAMLQLTATTATIMVSSSAIPLGGAETTTIQVTPTTATGTVNLYDGTALLATGALLSGHFTYDTTMLTAGAHSLHANYLGSSTYAASSTGTAPVQVQATLTITANDASRAFAVANPALGYTVTGYANGDTGAVLTGLPSLTTTATFNSLSGTYPITAAQGTLTAPSYYNLNFVPGTLTVTGNHVQSITFLPFPITISLSSKTLTLAAASSSALAVSYQVSGPATLSGSTLTLTGPGQVTVTAMQAGSPTFSPAISVVQRFTVVTP